MKISGYLISAMLAIFCIINLYIADYWNALMLLLYLMVMVWHIIQIHKNEKLHKRKHALLSKAMDTLMEQPENNLEPEGNRDKTNQN